MRESRMLGSVRGAFSNGRPYRDPPAPPVPFRTEGEKSNPEAALLTWRGGTGRTGTSN